MDDLGLVYMKIGCILDSWDVFGLLFEVKTRNGSLLDHWVEVQEARKLNFVLQHVARTSWTEGIIPARTSWSAI